LGKDCRNFPVWKGNAAAVSCSGTAGAPTAGQRVRNTRKGDRRTAGEGGRLEMRGKAGKVDLTAEKESRRASNRLPRRYFRTGNVMPQKGKWQKTSNDYWKQFTDSDCKSCPFMIIYRKRDLKLQKSVAKVPAVGRMKSNHEGQGRKNGKESQGCTGGCQ